MSKKQKLKELLDKINALDGSFIPDGELSDLTNKIINQEVINATDKIRQNSIIKTLERISVEVGKLKNKFDLSSIITAIKDLEKSISDEHKLAAADFDRKLADLKNEVKSLETEIDNKSDTEIVDQIKIFADNLNKIQDKFSSQVIENSVKETVFRQELSILEDKFKDLRNYDDDFEGIKEKLKKLQTDLITRTTHVGGQANRQINVDSSIMSTRYNDLNFKISSSIGWRTTNDDVNKRVDIVASILIATGGGGSLTVKEADGTPNVASVTTIVVSNGTLTDDGGGQITVTTGGGGGGITRTTSIVTATTTLPAAASTDYVFFCAAGIQILMPTAISNTDLYTIKNTSTSSVLVVASVGQAIDGSNTALMPTENESLTFISNNSVWGVV